MLHKEFNSFISKRIKTKHHLIRIFFHNGIKFWLKKELLIISLEKKALEGFHKYFQLRVFLEQ